MSMRELKAAGLGASKRPKYTAEKESFFSTSKVKGVEPTEMRACVYENIAFLSNEYFINRDMKITYLAPKKIV